MDIRSLELEHKASHDSLTGLLNRGAAQEAIQRLLNEENGRQFALAIVDLDYFKQVNDGYGHEAGDQVLKKVARLLSESFRNTDYPARIGGDEFLAFLEYHGDLEPIVKRIFTSLTGGKYENFPISISMGVARIEMVGADYDDLFHAADKALYTLKRSTRGNYRFYDPATMQDMLSVISPIESEGTEETEEKGETK